MGMNESMRGRNSNDGGDEDEEDEDDEAGGEDFGLDEEKEKGSIAPTPTQSTATLPTESSRETSEASETEPSSTVLPFAEPLSSV